MEIHELITTLTNQRAKLKVVDGELKISAGKGIITPELDTLIRRYKKDIIQFISGSNGVIRPAAPKDHYQLSSAQKRLYFLYELNRASIAYNDPKIFRLTSKLDRQKLSAVFEKLIRRHEILRTSFQLLNEEPVQRIAEKVDFSIGFFTTDGGEKELINDLIRPFDLSRPCLMRVAVIELPGMEHLLLVDMHHIITDGVSGRILMEEFLALYNGAELPPPVLQYKDYAEWQQGDEQLKTIAGQKEFWQNEFREKSEVLDLPADFARPVIKSFDGARLGFRLSVEETRNLNSIANAERTTLFMVILSIYTILLGKLSNREDIVIGTVTAGRPYADLEQMMGIFLNMLAIRNYPKDEMHYSDFLAALRVKTLACLDHQAYQYEELVDDLKVERDTGRNPLFDVMFIFQNVPDLNLSTPEITLEPYQYSQPSSKFDLTLTAMESDGVLLLDFEYSTLLFKAETIERFIGGFKKIVSAITADSNIKLSAIGILSGEEKDLLLNGFNATEGEYPRDETLVSLFEAQVQRTPHEIAVSCEGRQLTYSELDEQANRVALHLRDNYSIGAEQLVGIMMDRSAEMIIGLLGILKAGGAYVPLDPAYPKDRIEYILQDSSASVLLVDKGLPEGFRYAGPVMPVKEALHHGQVNANTRLKWINTSKDLCYLIYTSGSTGRPKGVMISHYNVVNFITGMNMRLPLREDDCMLAVTSTSFDISVLELFWTLCNGIEVVIHPTEASLTGLDRYVQGEDRAIDLSLFFFSSYNDAEEDKYRLLLESVKYADQQGFKAVWTPERHFHAFGGLFPNPAVTSAALAMVTRQIELRSGSVVSPLHDAIRIAEEWAVVDNLSGGRVGLSFAPGWNPNDFVLTGAKYKDRNKTMYEQIETVKKLWRGESIKRENGYGQEVEISVFPDPVRRELPVWITSSGNEETFKSAGAIGANLLTHLLGQDIDDLARKIRLYREARRSHGHPEDTGIVTVMLHTFVGDDINEIERLVEGPFIEYLKSSIGLSKAILEESGLREEDIPEDVRNRMLKNSFKRYYETSSLIGTKESCAVMVRKLKAIGVDEIGCLIDFGVAEDKIMEGLKHLSGMKRQFGEQGRQRQKPVTMMQSTPSLVGKLKDDAGSRKFLHSLRLLLVGGEAVPVSLINTLKKEHPAEIYNMYGPTETTIWSCMHRFGDHTDKVTIGKPILNTQVYILNKALQPLPLGVAGDLYIGGEGVARGYWKRPELTGERFLPNPFMKGEKMYMTGDVARWLPGGEIEFLGRMDQQVKVKGFRIELGEVESCLLANEGIREAAVLAVDGKGGAGKELAAYVVAEDRIDLAALGEWLGNRLPYYMMPAHYIFLKKLPLTPNGKLDRKALPSPEDRVGDDYVAPQTKEEKLLAGVWSKVLGADNVGITDNFFSVGGDSIKSIQIISRMRSAGYELSIKDIFIAQTIKKLAPRLKPTVAVSDQSTVTGRAELTPVQRWFFDGSVVAKHHYNQLVMLNFPGGIAGETVRVIFEKIQEHHDALRMVFPLEAGCVMPETRDTQLPVSLEIHDLRAVDDPASALLSIANAIQSGIKLAHGPLMRLGLFQMTDGARLLIVIHHLVVDGISWRILFEDIESLYHQVHKKEKLSLPLKTDSFQSWPAHLREYIQTDRYKKARAYWRNILGREPEPLPRDFPEGKNYIKDSDSATLILSRENTSRLLREVHVAFGTEINDILLAALLLAIQKQYGNEAVSIDLEGHGREEVRQGVNISRTVGWFTSIYRVLVEAPPGPLSATIKLVKETLRKVPNKGVDYLIQKYLDPDVPGEKPAESGRSSIFFNYLGQFDSDTTGKPYLLASEATGSVVSPEECWDYDMDILGMVIEGELRLRLMYSKNQNKPETITSLLGFYKESLEEIITYCCAYGTTELTPSDLTYPELSIAQLDDLQQSYLIQDVYLLSPMQEALLFHSLLDPDSEQYFLQISHRVNGSLDIDALEKSVNDLVSRYDILRTVFLHQGYPRPMQVVLKQRKADFIYRDLRKECLSRQRIDVIRVCEEDDRRRKFDLEKDMMIRLMVLQTGKDEFEFVWSYHHIIMDGWCIGIIIDEFKEMYAAHRNRSGHSLSPVKPYSDYIKWLEGKNKQESINYWKEYLSGYEKPAGLPRKARLSTEEERYELALHRFVLDTRLSDSLHNISREYGVTINTIFQVAWGLLLARYNNTQDVVFGSVISGRPADLPDADTMVGLFINTVPVRIKHDEGEPIGHLLQAVQNNAIENEQYNYISLAEIQSLTGPGRYLLDHLILFDNFPLGEKIDDSGADNGKERVFTMSDVRLFDQNNYDLAIVIAPGENILVRFDYNTHAYDGELITNVSRQLNGILQQMASDATKKAVDIDIVTEKEKEKLLKEFNGTDAEYPAEETIPSLFEKQADRSPEKTAIRFEGGTITYRQLSELSAKVASYLQGPAAIQAGDLVGILLEREEYLVPAIFGILKAGAAYVPVDPHIPVGRIDTILKDSGLKALITRGRYLPASIDKCITIINLDENLETILNRQVQKMDSKVRGSDLAYVIYTSGSTGKPKGVMIEHHSVINRILWMQKAYPIDQRDVLLLKTPIFFDVSVWELFWWSFTGASLCLLKPGVEKDPKGIMQAIEQNKVTTIHFVPSMLSAFLHTLEHGKGLPVLASLRQVFASGEALRPEQVDLFGRTLHKNTGARLINLYGPTEATVDVSHYECSFGREGRIVAIGKPIDNIRLYVLDLADRLSPVGVEGELCIAGVGLARGYLGNEQLTRERFVANPVVPGERIYRTGDLARWLPDGNIEYLGRIDNQVKIRGYRIEPGEIESYLGRHPSIRETVVLTLGEGENRYLGCYYVAADEIGSAQLKNFLSGKLPDYMIPAHFIRLEAMPLTANGKLDRKSLPAPEKWAACGHQAPRTPEEQLLATVWSKVLGAGSIGITDNFFSVGGDSIKSIQISSRMRSAGYALTVKDIFSSPTIKELCGKLKPIAAVSDQAPVTGRASLAPIQRWFIRGSLQGKHHYNQSVLLNFPQGITAAEVRTLFGKLQEHHDALRTVFRKEGESVIQSVRGVYLPLALEEYDHRGTADADVLLSSACNSIQSGIHLETGPLMKLGLFHRHDSSRLLIVIHHLVVDGVSWRILFEDIDSLYRQLRAGSPLSLPLKTDSFLSWPGRLLKYMESRRYEQAAAWWRLMLEKKVAPVPRDNPEGTGRRGDSRGAAFRLTREETSRLLTEAPASFNTQINDLLLAALLLAIGRQYGRDSVRVDLEGHGREDLGGTGNISRTVGWFTSLYPVILERGEGGLTGTIKKVKENLRKVPNNGIDYLLGSQGGSHSQILFNYLGQFDSDMEGRSYTLAAESPGEMISPEHAMDYDWEVSGAITGGQLEIGLRYSIEQYAEGTIGALMDQYKDSLMELIDHCCAQGKEELTPSDLTYKDLPNRQLDALQEQYSIEDTYPLSPMQEGMLFHSLLDPEGEHYFEQIVCRVEGRLDIAAVEKSLQYLVKRHDVLRTAFLHAGYQRPLQIVLKDRKAGFTYTDIRQECAKSPTEAVVGAWQATDRALKFRLNEDALIRLSVLRTAEEEYHLIWSHHHIIMDGWCMSLILHEFNVLYQKYKEGLSIDLPSVIPYSRYIEWLEKRGRETHEAYWKNYLSGYENLSTLSGKVNAGITRPRYVRGLEQSTLSRAQTSGLQGLSREYGVTMNTLFQAAWGILLSRYNNVNDVVFGSVVSGRPEEIAGVETMVGLFINTIPVRITFGPEDTIAHLVRSLQENAIEATPHHYHPLSEIQSGSALGRGLLDHILVFENYPVAEKIRSFEQEDNSRQDYRVVDVRIFEQTNYDLTVMVVPGEEITIRLDYNANVYDATLMTRILAQLNGILETMVADSMVKVAKMGVLTAEDVHQLLYTFNDTKLEYDREATLVSLFERQAQATPGKTAVVYGNTALTYRELNEQADRLGLYLRSRCGIGRGSLVAVMMARSVEMVVGLLGILKAGAAYVPVDPSYPGERIAYILEDSAAAVVLVKEGLPEGCTCKGTVLPLEKALADTPAAGTGTPVTGAGDPCYVIYTSGSTGRPKGVIISHNNVVNFMAGMSNRLPLGKEDCMLAVTSISFDISVLELFWTLCNGVEVVIHPTDASFSGLDLYLEDEDQAMDFSLFFFSSYKTVEKEKYHLLLESVRFADREGFKAVWTPERHFHEFGGLYPNPAVTSSALAMITREIELRSGSVVSPLHDAIRIAEEWSVVDNLSKGRVGLSFASGWNPNDFVMAPGEFKHRQRKMYEQIEEVRKLWRGESIKRANGFEQEVEVRIFPSPVREELPVWVTSSGSEETFRQAGAMGAHLLTHMLGQDMEGLSKKIALYRAARRENGYQERTGKVTVMLHTYIGEDIGKVEREVEGPFIEYLKSSIGLGKVIMQESGLNVDDIPEGIKQKLLKSSFRRYYKTSSLIGTQAGCMEMVQRLKEIGVDEIACLIDFGVEEEKVLEGLKQLNGLKQLFRKQHKRPHKPVTMLQSTPSLIRLMREDGGSERFLQSLRLLLVGGEAAPLSLINALKREYPAEVCNMYGPTETTIWSCMHRFESHQERVSIGRPIANTQVYILDGQYRLLPPGVPGDLYIGGQGLSAGYWNRPQLTEERFIPHPFEKGQKLYRTGDIGRWLPDGNLELLGREDRQVKISGYRIELGEIESCLLAARGVREAAVLVEEKGGEKLLAAYYVSDQPVDAASLKGYLAQKLPAYMIPARYTWMREMPLTPNGKTDLKALPGAGSDAGDVLLRRESDIAKVLAGIWSEILSIDEEAISIHANFFELGGHSINIIKLNTLVNERFNSNIPLVEMYRLPTIQSLEDFILNGERYDDPAGRTDMEAELAEANDIIGLMEGNNN